MKKLFFCFVFAVLLTPLRAASKGGPERMVVVVPVADVRSEPTAGTLTYDYDANRETQVLMGEVVQVLERKKGWVRVQCDEQKEFTHKSAWEGYPGWIEEKYLSSDLSKQDMPKKSDLGEDALRQKILDEARRHIGESYLWGGRSLHDEGVKVAPTGVDCSGLINWSFRQMGWLIPRDAHEQYMEARQIDPAKIKPGDLVFLAKANQPDKIVHVAFYSGDGKLLEAPQTGLNVREIPVQQRFGKSLKKMKNGMKIGDRIIYFGSFFGGTK